MVLNRQNGGSGSLCEISRAGTWLCVNKQEGKTHTTCIGNTFPNLINELTTYMERGKIKSNQTIYFTMEKKRFITGHFPLSVLPHTHKAH